MKTTPGELIFFSSFVLIWLFFFFLLCFGGRTFIISKMCASMHKNTDIQCVRYRTNSEYKSEQQVEYM